MTTIARLWEETAEAEAVESEKAAGRAEAPSLGEAFAQCADGLFRFILVRVGGDRDAADELLQECCQAAVRHRRLPQDPSVWSAWFAGIARNLIRRHWRERRRRGQGTFGAATYAIGRPASGMATAPLPDEVLISRDAVEGLLAAVNALGVKDQEVILAFYFDDRSSEQIAAQLGTTAKAVEGRLRRARERLRKRLQRAAGEDRGR